MLGYATDAIAGPVRAARDRIFRRRTFGGKLGMCRVGKAVDEMPSVVTEQRVVTWSERQAEQKLSMAAPFAPVHRFAGTIT
jgi:hypothetical protein